MDEDHPIPVETLTEAAFAEFGWVLGSPCPQPPDVMAFSHPGSDFWHTHDFDPGPGGQTEVLWVTYRESRPLLRVLEAHWLTEQAIVPLAGTAVVHVVCPTRRDGSRLPDLGRLRSFRVPAGMGVCMRPGCWHTSLAPEGPATCLMLTRHSTTRDLVSHLKGESVAEETSFHALAGSGGISVGVSVGIAGPAS
jgi:ureidoglycolate lyase